MVEDAPIPGIATENAIAEDKIDCRNLFMLLVFVSLVLDPVSPGRHEAGGDSKYYDANILSRYIRNVYFSTEKSVMRDSSILG